MIIKTKRQQIYTGLRHFIEREDRVELWKIGFSTNTVSKSETQSSGRFWTLSGAAPWRSWCYRSAFISPDWDSWIEFMLALGKVDSGQEKRKCQIGAKDVKIFCFRITKGFSVNYAFCFGFIVKIVPCTSKRRRTKPKWILDKITHILLFPPGSVVTFTNLVWISLGSGIQKFIRTGGCTGSSS